METSKKRRRERVAQFKLIILKLNVKTILMSPFFPWTFLPLIVTNFLGKLRVRVGKIKIFFRRKGKIGTFGGSASRERNEKY